MNHLKTHQTNPTTAQYRPVQSNTSTAQYSQVQPIPEPDPKPELFGQTRPEPDPKSKSPTRQGLILCNDSDKSYSNNHFFCFGAGLKTQLTKFKNAKASNFSSKRCNKTFELPTFQISFLTLELAIIHTHGS